MAGLGMALDGGASQTGEPASQDSALPIVDPANASPREPVPVNERPMLSDDVEETEMEEPTPEEQAAYTELEENCLRVIFPEGEDDAPASGIGKSLKATGDMVLNLATTTVSVLKGVLDSAARAKHPVNPEVIFPVGAVVLGVLADLAADADIHDFTDEELEKATLQATDLFRQQATASGLINPDAAKAEFGQVVEADKAGTLGKLVPGIGRRLSAEG